MGNPTVKAEIIRDRGGFDALQREWNELLKASAADTIFLTWEWMSAWLDAVHPDADLLVILVRDADGRLVAGAPFYRAELRLLGLVRYRCLRTLGDSDSGAEYADVVIRAGCEEEACSLVALALLDCCDLWDCVWLRQVADWPGASKRLQMLFSKVPVFMRRLRRTFSAVVLPTSCEEYFNSLSTNARSAIRRQGRRVISSGPREVIQCLRQEELSEFLSWLFDLHRQRWAFLGQEGCFTQRPLMASFYRRFAATALRNGWLRLLALRLNGDVEAVQYGYAYGGVFYQLQEGFNPAAEPGVGNVLRAEVLRACIREGLREYDFLGEHTDHKRRWGAEERSGADFFVGKKSLKNAIVFGLGVSPTGRYLRHAGPLVCG